MTRTRRVEAGMVTAEIAVALPALLLVLALSLAAVRLGVDRVRVVDAAHTAARLAARGEPLDRARVAGLAAAPGGAHLAVTVSGDTVRVEVSAPTPGLLAAVGVGTPSRASATARMESAAVSAGSP